MLSHGGERAADGSLPLPPGIEAIIARRIELLSPSARHLAQLAAIAGASYSIPLAASALACTPLALAQPVRELELRHVFCGRQFVHDVIATVTLNSVPTPVAEFMHRFVAEHLQAHGGDAAHIARHWQAGSEWRCAGQACVQAAQVARAAARANEHASLLDAAIAAFEQAPDAQVPRFEALDERAGAHESQGHEGLRPQPVARLQVLAQTEPQRLTALNHHLGWLTNLAQPVDEDRAPAAMQRARQVGRPDLARQLARMLSWRWAMNSRAGEGLGLLAQHEAWVGSEADVQTRAHCRLARSSIFAYGDRLPEALAEGNPALQAFAAVGDWPNALPAMSNLGVMHYWRGEYEAARQVLAQARAQRERLYGSSGSGIKIDIHLGAVLYELGRAEEARQMLHGALAEMATWPDSEYTRTERLLAHKHLALDQAEASIAALAHDASGVAERFYGRRLTLRLCWQRQFGASGQLGGVDPTLHAELQAVAARVASPFNRTLMELELARHMPPPQALALCLQLRESPVAQQRPGLQLHALVLAAHAAQQAGDGSTAASLVARAKGLQARYGAFDLGADELSCLLAPWP